MTRSMSRPGQEVVNLLSDREEDAEDFLDLDKTLDNADAYLAHIDHETIDLTAIPDIDVPPSDPILIEDEAPDPDAQTDEWGGEAHLITEAACLQMVLNVLPDISVDHALKTIQEKTTDATRTTAQCEQIVTQLLDGEAYPKEADELKNNKRKREDDGDLSDYEKGVRDPEVVGYEHDALELLRDEFLSVPVWYINDVLKQQKTFFKAYGLLEEQVRNYQRIETPFAMIRKPRTKRGTEVILIEQGSQLPKELHAAKKKNEEEAAKRRKAEEAEEAEEANLQRAQRNDEMGECACCFNDVPLNRMVSCNGDTLHFYCIDCPRQQIEIQMGQSRCRPKCFGVDDCNGTFSRAHLQQVLSERTFERLEHMQQLEDLKAANLEFLSECPFCDFRMECPPVEVDREFRCQNTKCAKTSCRLCQKESHIPLSCEEAKKDGQLTLRHIVEEAMSAALIRHCNQCKHAFIKEYGCNKMACTHCGNVQCYICSKNVTDYQHFGEAQRAKCPLHENIEDRHEQEVKRAADEAMAKVRADNPGLSDTDLMVKVSDRVKQAEDARRNRAAADANAFPYQMVGNVLNRVPVLPPVIPPPAQYVHHYPPVGYFAPALQQQPHPPQGLRALMNMLPGRVRRRGDEIVQGDLAGQPPQPPLPQHQAVVAQLDHNRNQLRQLRQQHQQDQNGHRLRVLRLQQANQELQQRAVEQAGQARIQAHQARAQAQAHQARAQAQAHQARAQVQAHQARAQAQAHQARAQVQAHQARAQAQAQAQQARAQAQAHEAMAQAQAQQARVRALHALNAQQRGGQMGPARPANRR